MSYTKQQRVRGHSSWTLKKKVKLFVDSVASFRCLPIRLMSYAGIVTALGGFVYAAFIFVRALAGHRVPGWSSLMVVVLVASGFQMLMMGVLGEYLWRALDEALRRPRYLIEAEPVDYQRRAQRQPGATRQVEGSSMVTASGPRLAPHGRHLWARDR